MKSIRDRLYLSTIAEDDYELAAQYGVGLEIAEFCTAMNMDGELFECFDGNVRIKMKSADRFVFHAPFAELSPCSIDPRVRQVSMERYLQAIDLAAKYGIHRVVIHSGFIPRVYFDHWFVEESIKFWRELLAKAPQNVQLLLENVMEHNPGPMCTVVRKVNDPRLRMCFDVGHYNVSDHSFTIWQWLESFRPYLCHVHIHNNDGVIDTHSPLGEGTVDMAAVLDWLNANAPEATITIENMNCSDSMQWLEKEGYL